MYQANTKGCSNATMSLSSTLILLNVQFKHVSNTERSVEQKFQSNRK